MSNDQTNQQLRVQNLSAYVERSNRVIPLLNNVSFSLQPGQIVALIGASGSGKSLTCSASLGMLPPGVKQASGSVYLNENKVEPNTLRGKVISSVVQNPRSAFNPVYNMRHHAYETLSALSIYPKSQWNTEIIQAMRAAGLDNPQRLLNLYPFEMSGGMLQRMMIALALVSNAPYLFADEPTTDLDLIVQREILRLIKTLTEKRNLGTLLITHDMGVVAAMADRVLVMDKGQIIETGTVIDIFTNPIHPKTRQLLDAHLSLYQLEGAV